MTQQRVIKKLSKTTCVMSLLARMHSTCAFSTTSMLSTFTVTPRTYNYAPVPVPRSFSSHNKEFKMVLDPYTEERSTSTDYALDPYSTEARQVTKRLGITDDQHETLSKHAELVVEWNDRLNLISRKDCTVEVVFGRHILPSLALAALDDFPLEKETYEAASAPKAKIADIGTGGGFPGVPLAIIYPESDFLLVDSVGKKLKAIEEMVAELGLTNVKTHHGRAEEIVDDPINGRKQKNSFDIVVGRSVSALPRFCFWVQDLLKKKGKDGSDEGRLVYIIGGEVEKSVTSRLIADHAIDDLLGCEGASDKRTLIVGASDVVKIAKESGEMKQKRGGNKSKKNKNIKAKTDNGGEWRNSRGGWGKKDNTGKKQRGYENFKRYGTD